MNRGKPTNISTCVDLCEGLSPRNSYGITVPLLPLDLTFLVKHPALTSSASPSFWFGLIASQSVTWSRYSPRQVVLSFGAQAWTGRFPRQRDKIIFWRTPLEFELPVHYRNGWYVVDPLASEMVCICQKGNVFLLVIF